MLIKFNDDGSYGFYTPEIHGEEIIDNPDYIEITDEAYRELMNNQWVKTLSDNAKTLSKIDMRSIVDVPEVPEPIESINRRTLSETLIAYQNEMRAFNAMSNPNITDADMKRAIKRLNRASIKLIRIVLNKLDGLE